MSKVTPDPGKWIKILDRMLESPDYQFARDWLQEVRSWVAENDQITKKQMEAINNIRRGRL